MSDPYYDDGNPYAPPPPGPLEEDRRLLMLQNIDKIRRSRWWLFAGLFSLGLPILSCFLSGIVHAFFNSLGSGLADEALAIWFFVCAIAMILVPPIAVLETTYWLRVGFFSRAAIGFLSAVPPVAFCVLVALLIIVEYELKMLDLHEELGDRS